MLRSTPRHDLREVPHALQLPAMLLPPHRFSPTHSARVSLHKPAVIALCLFIALSLLGWRLFAPAASVFLPSPALSRALPRFWSATGGGDLDGVTNYEKPLGFRIVALVFYGRPASVSILDCYLKVTLPRVHTEGRTSTNASPAQPRHKRRPPRRSHLPRTHKQHRTPPLARQARRDLALLPTAQPQFRREGLPVRVRCVRKRDHVHQDR